MKPNLPLAALGIMAVVTTAAVPAEAATFDLRYAYEMQNWNVPTPTGTSLLGFMAPMHTFTVTDHSGTVLSFGSALARTEGGRMSARDEAIRRRESSYSYAIYAAEPKPGLQLGMTLGTTTPSGFTGTGLPSAVSGGTADLSISMMRFFMGSDLFPVFYGMLAWELAAHGTRVFGASSGAPSTGGAGTIAFNSSALPLGLSYRLPVWQLPLLLEPYADVDFGTLMASGFKSFDAHDYGLRLAYLPHPMWRLEGRVHNARMSSESRVGSGTANKGIANLFMTSFGTTMTF